MTNPNRYICGLAATFGQPGHDGRTYTARHFRAFLNDTPDDIPIRSNHHRRYVDDQGRVHERLGQVDQFALVPESSTPAGLLVLGRLDPGAGDGFLIAVRDSLSARSRTRWGLSIGGVETNLGAYTDTDVWVAELSITEAPNDDDAVILAAGPRALDVWELLTDSLTTVAGAS